MATPPPTPPLLQANATTNTPLASFNYKISVKLDEQNYLVWLQQIEPVLRAHRLHRFCVSPDIPPQFLNDADRLSNTENPAYSAWELQDQLLLAWLQASLSPSILPSVIGCRHTFQLWENIHQTFQSKTKAQARQLRTQLRTTKKGTSSISEFLAKIKHISDSLISIGEPVSTQDQLDVILEGLPTEYEALVTLINSKIEWFDVDEIRALLLAQEQRLEKRVTEDLPSLNLTQAQSNTNCEPQQQISQANFTSNSSGTQNPNSTASNPNFAGNKGNSQSRGRGGRFGRRGGRNGGRSNVTCQVCQRPGHEASYCYHRFNDAFGSYQYSGNPYQYLRQPAGNNSQWPQNAAAGFPQANYTGHYGAPLQNNALDTAATQHVTTQPAPPGAAPPPTHLENIFLGNGQGLPVQSLSSFSFPSPSHPNTTLHLNNVLHVPSLNKNLVSVSKFALDNNAYIQFHPFHYVMKSQVNDQVLLQGRLDSSGLYPLQPSKKSSNLFPSVNYTVPHTSTAYFKWHHRLGHPSIETLNNVLKLCNLSTFQRNDNSFCIACCLGKSHKLPTSPSQTIYNAPLELVFCDLWVPAPMSPSLGYKYYVSFVDAFSRFT